MTTKQLAIQYCEESPEYGQIFTKDGKEGILFTGPDAESPNGDFIPFDDLGYNQNIGFFEKHLFPDEPTLP